MVDISIIVPIYNARNYLDKCISSLIHQTKKELEFILVNDGSTDDSEKIIKKYKDKRIKYFKNENKGIGYTRNFGIKKATGKYLMFLDSDDYLREDACETLYKFAEENNLDLTVCDFYRVKNNTLLKEKITDFSISSLKDNPRLISIINLGPCNKLYKKNLIEKNNISFEENLKYEDTPFVFDAIKYSKRIGKTSEPLHYYLIHSNSETTIRDENIFDILKIIDKIRLKNKESYLKEDLDKLTVRMITNYTIQQRNQKSHRVGLEFINKAFKYLKREVPDYKKNKYYQNRSVVKRAIEKSKILTILYCKLYWLING